MLFDAVEVPSSIGLAPPAECAPNANATSTLRGGSHGPHSPPKLPHTPPPLDARAELGQRRDGIGTGGWALDQLSSLLRAPAVAVATVTSTSGRHAIREATAQLARATPLVCVDFAVLLQLASRPFAAVRAASVGMCDPTDPRLRGYHSCTRCCHSNGPVVVSAGAAMSGATGGRGAKGGVG